ncbi:AAA domain-containing protein [Rhodococcus sp. RD6.2]|uniref:AAA domain-containing protein n=1 Tax=Rhodococcus sp. RD6.2 TaxID=260936 RepID=UPI00155DA65D|nr:AAA domain-containing protein [Rhodococcus sp. RD6.2]
MRTTGGGAVSGDWNSKADIVAFWRAVELFSPQTVPKVDRLDTQAPVEKVSTGSPLPWETGHRLAAKPPRRGFQRRHVVYLGVYRIDDVWVAVDHILDPGTENFDPRPAGDCALAAILVDEHGRFLPDTAIVSGLAWAAGRTRNPGPGDPLWLDGFGDAGKRFAKLVDDVQSVDEDRGGRAPLDDAALLAIRARTEALLDLGGLVSCTEIRVRSVEVRESDGVDSTDFLNSFIAADLDLVRGEVAAGNIGVALSQYLTEDSGLDAARRVDVHAQPSASLDGCRPGATPLGRWPNNPDRPLALGQQFAVNSIMGELADGAGIFAVNGPPGTGKSTLLRDLVAAIVVERANRLADLRHPADAFTAAPHRWKAGDYTRVVQRWAPTFHGFEIVVASSNNGAVENISHEMPAAAAIDSTVFEADYFGDIASALLPDDEDTAWALTAARLGRKSYRTRFADTLWFDEKEPRGKQEDGPPRVLRRGIQSILKTFESSAPQRPWRDAVADYETKRARVAALLAERQRAHDELAEATAVRRRLVELDPQVAAAADALRRGQEAETHARSAVDREGQGRTAVAAEIESHDRTRPAWWRMVGKKARAERERWQARSRQLSEALARWDATYQQVWAAHQETMHVLVDAQGRHEPLAREQQAGQERLHHLDAALDLHRERWGNTVPEHDWHDDTERRELAAPWSDPEVAEARSRLFLAALTLHREFLAHVPKQMRQSLHGAYDVVTGASPRELGADAVADAWRALFFLVPVMSSTFASFDRVFRGLGAESLGWLLIDEAGQATPQNPVGAIWRARRTVVVGDPIQLEPVVTLPFRAQQAVRRTFGVSERWLPARGSAQSLADRLNRWGTTLSDGEEPIWVGAPLRVHRRCDDPMFTIVNTIAYDGTMLHGRDPSPSGPLQPSQWMHVTGPSSGHYVRAEHDLLIEQLNALRDSGHEMSEVIVITPFRQVASRLVALERQYPGLSAGTVHRAQGKEADVVFFVLGGDPSKDGAKRWAASKPNLANVAISRAKERLYVIGDRDAWSRHPRFDVLARELARHE